MRESFRVSRRVTGDEEAELRAASARVTTADADASAAHAERDQLVADIVRNGGRVADIAEILGMSRAAVYAAIERADRN